MLIPNSLRHNDRSTDICTLLGYLWVYLVPDWADDLIEQMSTKWRNALLFLYYGEDFTHPPPLEVDETAVHPPVRTPAEEAARFHPKHGFQPGVMASLGTSYPGSPPPSPSRKSRRKEQLQQYLLEQQQQRQQQHREEEEEEEGEDEGEEGESAESVSVWDPTWGVISREVQASWRGQEARREQARQRARQQLRQGKPLPPPRAMRSATPEKHRPSSPPQD
jgi:hypothetical protein